MIELVNRFGGEWSEYFGYAVIQNTLFLGLIYLVLRLLRRASANMKYLICLTGLVKLLLPPLIPASLLVGSTSLSQISGVMVLIPTGTMPAGANALPSHPVHLNLPGILLLIWAGGLAFYIAAALISTLRLRTALSSAVPVDGGAWIEERFRDRVQIYKSDRIPVPLTFGLFPRRIYVPGTWDRWSDKCRRMVISHELAHIRRRDGLTQALQILAGAIYLFNPLVWWLNRRLNQYREMACDDAVVAGNEDEAMEYSRYLVGLAEALVSGPRALGPASALLKYRRGLAKRIDYQMGAGNMHIESRKSGGLVLAALLVFVLPLSWYCGGPETGQGLDADTQAAYQARYEGMHILQIAVRADGEITVDGEVTALEDLGRRLDDITGDNKEKVLIILVSEDDVMMDMIREIQDTLVEMDLRKIVYAKEAGGSEDLTLVLPSESDQERLEQIPQEHIAILQVGGGLQASLDGEPIDLFDIPEAVKARISEDPHLIVVIRSSGASGFDDFATVLALAKKGGATRISVDILR
jgi:beta-lactamase regulating signal transducer with metallopeptidase domain/biopolymer transport protein ExbD